MIQLSSMLLLISSLMLWRGEHACPAGPARWTAVVWIVPRCPSCINTLSVELAGLGGFEAGSIDHDN